jgi:hypothetical protein
VQITPKGQRIAILCLTTSLLTQVMIRRISSMTQAEPTRLTIVGPMVRFKILSSSDHQGLATSVALIMSLQPVGMKRETFSGTFLSMTLLSRRMKSSNKSSDVVSESASCPSIYNLPTP